MQAARTAAVDWESEQERYLGRIEAEHTRRNYGRALSRLCIWCVGHEVDPTALSPAAADDWIDDERHEYAPNTVNLDVTAASAFWTWLERRHPELRNHFRGTRARPKRRAVRPLDVPSPEEIRAMIAGAEGITRAAVVALAATGLRRGALQSLRVDDGIYQAWSKGRRVKGAWPEEAARAVRAVELDEQRPFAGIPAPQISERIRRLTLRLHDEGQLAAVYSAHDLRHAFAVAHYRAHHDVFATSRALHHASVGMTAVYLRSLPGIVLD